MLDFIQISDTDKQRLISFINENDLDYTPVDNGIIRFHLIAEDKMKFFFYEYNNECVVVKCDPVKEQQGDHNAFQYFNYKSFTQVLEQISFYDKSLPKTYWEVTPNSIDVGFDKDTYNENWHQDILDDNYILEDYNDQYKYINYTNEKYKPELKSPYNTIGEVTEIHQSLYTKVEKLNFEIHPISLEPRNEKYFVKLLCNNESIFKEYINYKVSKKKGLKILLETLFNSLENFKVN